MIKQSEYECYRRAGRLSGLGYWSIDVATNTLAWSDQVFIIHGLEPGSVEPTIDFAVSFYHPDDRDTAVRYVNN